MTDQVDEDGFTKVTHFKYKAVANNRKKNRKNKYSFKDPDEWKLEDLNRTLDQRKETLVDSRFFKDLSVIFEESLLYTKPHDIVCYGIGSMHKSKNAQYQFVLALIIREILKISGTMYIFDPVMTDLDKELCASHNIKLITENEDGKRVIDRPTLFYMPHCGRGLYSNTLSANWSRDRLPLVTIIGNKFDMYVGSQLQKDLIRECPYLITAVDIVNCIAFPKEFDNNQIFNDISIQTFPTETVDKLDDDFWSNVPTLE
ncbi:SRR1-domain-containing protein [Mycotypha africana]|uniref:SRR1-domain-containing protein n=1 Tax=Mycotypha africana TaxID=64632 RepID=UPI0023004AC5|nr:SRR1-domain-containing protein [Mycotypha africana]KAI8971997.1 SRR1-domain-containing protein [Mycotypha africana]